jgi:hypothetical protein
MVHVLENKCCGCKPELLCTPKPQLLHPLISVFFLSFFFGSMGLALGQSAKPLYKAKMTVFFARF